MKVENCGDIMFCELNFKIMFLTLVRSALSMGIIVYSIWPLSTGIIVDLNISCWVR